MTRNANNSNGTVPGDLLMQLRRVVPKRALAYGESLRVGQMQAALLRQLLGVTSTAMPFDWAVQLPNVRINLVPAHRLGEGMSGLTTRTKSGDYVIAINRNNSHTHRRFTLAHELKHLVDFPFAQTLHASLGYGDAELKDKQVEWIADHFAAHLLMPSPLIKRAWGLGFQDAAALAGMFKVSREAMIIRLRTLGFIEDEQRPLTTYFRKATATPGCNVECGTEVSPTA